MIHQDYQNVFPGSDTILRRILPNGLTVLVHENHLAPAAVITGYLNVGSLDEKVKHLGLANFTVDVMQRGTIHRSFDQLFEEVESIGASFGISSGTFTTYFGAKGLSDHLPLLLDILKDTICHPAFSPEQVEKSRAELMTDIQERIHDTQRMANLTMHELAYPATHPYHWSHVGYTETLSAIQHADLVAFHADYFSPRNMVLVIVGDVDAERAIAQVTNLFSDWNQNAPDRNQLPKVPKLTQRLYKSVEVADKVQSNIVMGWPGPSRTHPDFLACFLGNTVLGVFGLYGRLGKRIREERSLAYYAYSSISGGLGPGPWRIMTGVDPENVADTLALIKEVVQRIVEEPIQENELEDSKAFLTGSLPLQLETSEGIAHAIINIERHNLGLDYLRNYKAAIMTISPTDVQEALERWIHPDYAAVAVAGPTPHNIG